MQYPDMFKNAMIQKMTGPGAISATALSELANVSQATLSKWLRMAGVDPVHAFPNNIHEYTKMTKIPDSKRPNNWSPENKLKVVTEADALDDAHLANSYVKKACTRLILNSGGCRCSMAFNPVFLKRTPRK